MPFVSGSTEKLRSVKLEYNVVEHCNYACRECSHFSPYMPVHESNLDTFVLDLEALARVYHVDRFRFVGGEPLLHKNLAAFITAVRDSGIAGSIEVVTNGSMLHKTSDEVFAAIDELSVSWYADKRCDQGKIDLAQEKCNAYGTRMKISKAAEFRMMQLTQPVDDPALRHDIYRTCQIAHSWYCQTLLNGYFYMCSRPLFTQAYLRQRGVEAPDLRAVDGVALHEPDLRGRLVAYLNRSEPLESCRHCLGTVGKRIEWGQMPLAERRETGPLDRRAEDAVSRPVLAYLSRWERLERAVLRVLPSVRVARGLTLVKEAVMRAVLQDSITRDPRRFRRRRRIAALKARLSPSR